MEQETEQKALLKEILKKVCSVEDTLHKHNCEHFDHLDALYHSVKKFRTAMTDASPRDKYKVAHDGQTEFGHELFIPYSFSVVETVLPRLLSNRPRMLVLPRGKASERNVENMRATIDAQMAQIDYELILQAVAKSGLIYGLGWQKTGWKKREAPAEKVVPASFVLRALGHKYSTEKYTETLFDDPYAEQCDVYDVLYDGFASSPDNASWIAHRTWRTRGYVQDRLKSGVWDEIDMEEFERQGGSAEKYASAWAGRLSNRGMPKPTERDSDIHEVIEFHDRCHIVTILDRQWVVRVAEDTVYYGRLGFQAYRPTEIPNQMRGKGEIEPIEDLQMEINAMRTDRRWNALMVLHKAYFYNDGLVDPTKIRIGPGELNPVNGDPRELLHEVAVGDIPNSSYREEQAMQGDIERTTGISDSTAGADSGAAQTATGIQLVQAAANARIQMKTRRAEVELCKPAAKHWARMNQRMILDQREYRAEPPSPDDPERRWSWFPVGPGELAGEFDFEVEGGSTTPENVPQKRQDAQIKMQLLGALPEVNRRLLLVTVLEDLGFKHPEGLLNPPVHVPPQTLDLIVNSLVEQGADPQLAQQVVAQSYEMALDMEEQAALGGNGAPQPAGGPQESAPPVA
jgi:hypothetical protein